MPVKYSIEIYPCGGVRYILNSFDLKFGFETTVECEC
jgi:hypothetical protein